MKVYSKKSVYEKSLEWVFKGHIVVGCSGGKDSTVVIELALEVVRKLKSSGVLPKDYRLKVMWLDQEVEWTRTREYIEDIAKNRQDEIELYWIQCYFNLGHNGSLDEVNKLNCWDTNFNGMTDEDICNELGLETDELIRLKYTTGVAELFKNSDFSRDNKPNYQIKREYDPTNANSEPVENKNYDNVKLEWED